MSKPKQKKGKKQLLKLINASDSEDDVADHELSHYVNDRIKLMKEVLKIIKPRKIKSMAPACVKVGMCEQQQYLKISDTVFL